MCTKFPVDMNSWRWRGLLVFVERRGPKKLGVMVLVGTLFTSVG